MLSAGMGLWLGCGGDAPTRVPDPGPPIGVPDFRAEDVNPNSPRFEEAVSPRDYLESVSAWYFGHAT
jgi:hypothetical protein